MGAVKTRMKTDMILVDIDRVLRDPWMIDDLPIAEAFVHRAMGEDVDTAIVGGRVVMEGRRMTTLDVDTLYREIRRAARAIDAKQRRYAETLRRVKAQQPGRFKPRPTRHPRAAVYRLAEPR